MVNLITLGQSTRSQNSMQMITLIEGPFWVAGSDNTKQLLENIEKLMILNEMIALTWITISGLHY